jgi:hypothetical protein
MNLLRRLFKRQADEGSEKSTGIPMTEQAVDFSFRVYWMKLSTEQQWDLTRIQELRSLVLPVTQRPDFRKNLVDRRYTVDGLGTQAHSGASLLALLEVLDGIEAYLEKEGD